MDRGAAAGAAAAGAVNGLFGGGGGMVLLPVLGHRLPEGKLYPTCVGVMFPVCALSAGVYLLRGGVSAVQAAPYLAGGLLGGLLGGRLYRNVPSRWLRRLFAAFLIYGGLRYLLW